MSTDYKAALDALDTKAGRVHTIHDWQRVGQKVEHAPEMLTDADIVILGYFGGEQSAACARSRRAAALAPPVAQPAPVVIKTVSTAAPPTTATSHDDDLTWDQFVEKHGARPMTFKATALLVAVLMDQMKAMNAKNVERNTKMATLEAEVEKLRARPLQKWAGVHIAGVPYSEASLVTKGGSLWVATTATTTTPGEPGADWRLIVKRGHA